MKKIFTLFAALAMVMSMSAATKTIYCKMAQSWWKADGAAVGAYAWKDGGASNASWPGVRMTPVTGETDLWSVDIDTDKYQKIIFTRVNGSGTVSDWGAKTADQNIPTDDKNLFTITSTSPVWGNPGVAGNWSVYAPDAPKTYKDITITIVANATPKIHYWEGGDKVVGTEWDAKPEMVATGEENTYSYTIKEVDEATGVKYLVVVGDVQSADQQAFENVTKNFKELLPQVAVMGVNNWDGTDKMTVADDYLTASVTLALEAAKDYELKLTVNGEWFGSNAITITKDNNSASFAENGDGNGKLTTDAAGDYVFTYTYATKTLVVTYPVPATEIVLTEVEKAIYPDWKEAMFSGVDATLGNINVTITNYEGYGTYTEGVSAYISRVEYTGSAVFENKGETDLLVATLTNAETAEVYVIKAELPVSKTSNITVTDAVYVLSKLTWGEEIIIKDIDVDGQKKKLEITSSTEGGYDANIDYEYNGKVDVVFADDNSITIQGTITNLSGDAYVLNITATPKPAETINVTLTDMNINITEWSEDITITAMDDDYEVEVILWGGKLTGYGTYDGLEAYINYEFATLAEGTVAKYYKDETTGLAVVEMSLIVGVDTYNVTMTGSPWVAPEDIIPTDTVNAVITNARIELIYSMFWTIQGTTDDESIEVSVNTSSDATSVTASELGYAYITTPENVEMSILRGDVKIVEITEYYVAYINVLCSDRKWYNITVTTGATVPANPGTGVNNINATVAPVKMIKNGQLIIRNNGVEYNAQGAIVK